jgi:hypothetical protein
VHHDLVELESFEVAQQHAFLVATQERPVKAEALRLSIFDAHCYYRDCTQSVLMSSTSAPLRRTKEAKRSRVMKYSMVTADQAAAPAASNGGCGPAACWACRQVL